MRKKFIIGILVVLSLLVGAIPAFSRQKVADLGDVRIYYHYQGYFEVESDRTQQCFALTFREKSGWIEVACSSYVQKATEWGVEKAVYYVVTTYLGGNAMAGSVASKVASWAAAQGIDYLCN